MCFNAECMPDFYVLIENHWCECIFYSKTNDVAQGQFTRCQRFGAILRALEPWRSVWKCASIWCVSAINVFYEFYTNLHGRHPISCTKNNAPMTFSIAKAKCSCRRAALRQAFCYFAAPQPLRMAMKSVATPWVSIKKCHATTQRPVFSIQNTKARARAACISDWKPYIRQPFLVINQWFAHMADHDNGGLGVPLT